MKKKELKDELIELQKKEILRLESLVEELQYNNLKGAIDAFNQKETIQDVANELDSKPKHVCGLTGFGVGLDGVKDVCPACDHEVKKRELNPTGLPKSWCVDIRVDDPRMEGFKEWFKKKQDIDCNFHFDYYGYSTDQTRWSDGDPYLPQVITLNQFEQMSGVNLMEYIKKEEVKPEVEKTYTKDEIIEQYGKFRMDKSFDSGFLDWIYEKM